MTRNNIEPAFQPIGVIILFNTNSVFVHQVLPGSLYARFTMQGALNTKELIKQSLSRVCVIMIRHPNSDMR